MTLSLTVSAGIRLSDASTYRSEEELEEWRKADPIRAYKEKLIIGGVASSDEFDAIDETIIRRMTKICRLAIDETLSPRMDLEKDPDAIARIMYSNGHKKTMEEGREPEVLMPKADNPRVKSLALKARWASTKRQDSSEGEDLRSQGRSLRVYNRQVL